MLDPSRTRISPERPDTAEARALIAELEAQLEPLYPSESRHDGAPAGCGGVQLFGTEYAELKRMYVRPWFRGLGLAKAMLTHLAEHARERGVGVLRLETGIHQREAIGLYESEGFRPIPPFGDYKDDPLSSFYEKRLVRPRTTRPHAPGIRG